MGSMPRIFLNTHGKQRHAKQMHYHINTVLAVYAKATEGKCGTYFEKHRNLREGHHSPPNEIEDPEMKTGNKHSPKGVHYRPPSAHQ